MYYNIGVKEVSDEELNEQFAATFFLSTDRPLVNSGLVISWYNFPRHQ